MNDTSVLPESQTLNVNGLQLHHLDWGSAGKHPVVMIHGIRLHAFVWGDFCRKFSTDWHVLSLDQRGHGDSEWAAENHYHLHDYMEDLHGVLDARGFDKVTLIGHSLGGRVAMLYAYLHPERVSRLILADSGAGMPSSLGTRDFSRVTETPPPQDFDSPEEAIAYLGAILKLAPPEMIEESVRQGIRRNENGRYTWKYDPRLGGRPQPRPDSREWDLWEALRGIDCPTLLLHGEMSKVVTPEIVTRMKSELPSLLTEEIKQAGHALFTDQPEAFAASVARFFAATPV